ncbi:MmcQ/YjbR family DNA-binding protein [Deminuibacter soli]|uniref:MmcQ/YjbR family DNA-binding protein n=1 Tax=Deminuibacter soli TaxID=2291815 RepID=A0A3E1NPT7_9BACT|nr:MmcQ/YjbR family DNA-binding protein [Deminuibacter soli]RFM29933.1 MmcQ/YjbR family DNA-binding protein [Deminuibacter soli]
MDIESLRAYCLSKKGATEEFPFGEETLVFKVLGKIFLLTGLSSGEFTFNVKCDPVKAEELRERYDAVRPGYHMNKKHWNTVQVDGRLSSALLKEMIDDSYALVVQSLPKKQREELGAQ